MTECVKNKKKIKLQYYIINWLSKKQLWLNKPNLDI